MRFLNPVHKRILELLDDSAIHNKLEFNKICSSDGLRGRISELNKWGYVIRRVDDRSNPAPRGDYFKLITIPIRESINELISVELKPHNGKVELIPLGDCHYGNPCFTDNSEEKLDGYIDYIMNHDGVYTILMGDLIESAMLTWYSRLSIVFDLTYCFSINWDDTEYIM